MNQATNRVYAGNTGGSTLTTQQKSSQAAVGQIPCAIAVDSTASRIYVANYAGRSVTVLDASCDGVLATIEIYVIRKPSL